MNTILVIDDEKAIRKTLGEILQFEGYKVQEAGDGQEGLQYFQQHPCDLVFCDIKMPKMDGLEFLEKARAHNPDVPIIIISGHGNLDTAVEAVKKGAFDYISKPPDLNRLLITLRNALDRKELVTETKVLKKKINLPGEMIGSGLALQKIKETIDKVAPTDARVLIYGENGVGKELVARWIHEKSARSAGPLVEVNCAAIPSELIESELFGHEKGSFTGASRQHRGYFERAHGGTLFLDEVTEMPMDLQVKLLRVLETGVFTRVGSEEAIETDVRIIAATNREPLAAVREGSLREDLYYRLDVFEIQLPPLRERLADAALLARSFLEEINRTEGLTLAFGTRALESLASHDWPGNVRELRNVIHRSALMADEGVIEPLAMPTTSHRGEEASDSGQVSLPVGTTIAQAERELILATLEHCGGQREPTADMLGISLKTLYNRLREYDQSAS